MAMSMKEKASNSHVKTEWPAALKAEFAREAETAERLRRLRASLRDRQAARVDHPAQARRAHRLPSPRAELFLDVGERRARAPAPDGRHHDRIHLLSGRDAPRDYGAGEFKVHDLENLGEQDMIFMTVEFDRGLGEQAAAGSGNRAAEGGVTPYTLVPAKAGPMYLNWLPQPMAARTRRNHESIEERRELRVPSSGRTCATNWSGRTITMQPRSRSMPRMVKMSWPLFRSAQKIFS